MSVFLCRTARTHVSFACASAQICSPSSWRDAIRSAMASVHHPHARPNIPLSVCVPDLAKPRRLVYRCMESMLDVSDVADYRRAMMMLYGADRLPQAETLLNRSFFRLKTLGADMQGSAMHRTLPVAYDELSASSIDAVA